MKFYITPSVEKINVFTDVLTSSGLFNVESGNAISASWDHPDHIIDLQ